ncbi:MAG: 4Fe-4S binding protein [Planctomycetes bacterium]|nr:4Fe-4S binding protein [Planctomycetota bacterium]
MELPFGWQGDRLVIRKVIERALLPLGNTAIDLTPFLMMAGLSVVAALLMRWKFPHRQWARHVVQTISAAALIVGVHPCACMTRDIILGANALGRDDLGAFKYLIVFATVAAFTMLFGRVFCGWICPLGFAQELLAKLTASTRGEKESSGGIYERYILGVLFLGVLFYSSYRTKPATFSFIEHAMVFYTIGLSLIALTVLTDTSKDWFFKRFRYALLASIFAVFVYGVYANGPFCVFFTAYVEWASLISCFGVLLLSIVLMNAWCRYMCPEGAMLGLLANHSAWQINRNDSLCQRDGCCEPVCPVDCIVMGIRDRQTCLYCMKCVDACPYGALEIVNELAPGKKQGIPFTPRATKYF